MSARATPAQSRHVSGVIQDVLALFKTSRLIGLCPYTLPDFCLSKPWLVYSTLLITILCTHLVVFLILKIVVYDIEFVSQNLTLIGLTIYAALAVIQEVRTQNKVQKIFRKLNKMDIQLNCIGLKVPSFKRHIKNRLFYVLVILGLHQTPDFLIWLTGQYSYHVPYVLSVTYCQAVHLLSVFHFLTYLHFVYVRYEIINEKIKSFGSSKILFVRDFKSVPRATVSEEALQMKVLLRIHNSLCSVAHITNQVYSIQMLLSIASCFAYITSNIYYLSITLLNIYQLEDLNKGYRKHVFMFFCSYWILYVFLLLMFIVKACDRAVTSAQRTSNICHDIQVKERLPHLKLEMQAFSDLLEYQKIHLTSCGLFPLDYTLVYSIIGGAATYCIIIIQFGYH